MVSDRLTDINNELPADTQGSFSNSVPACSFWSAVCTRALVNFRFGDFASQALLLGDWDLATVCAPDRVSCTDSFGLPISCTWFSFWSHGLGKRAWFSTQVLPLFLIPAQGQSPSFCSALARLVFPARGLSFFVRFWSVSLLKFSPGLRCRSDLASWPGFTPVPMQFVLALPILGLARRFVYCSIGFWFACRQRLCRSVSVPGQIKCAFLARGARIWFMPIFFRGFFYRFWVFWLCVDCCSWEPVCFWAVESKAWAFLVLIVLLWWVHSHAH
jgi:hypothetical protein